MEMLFDDDGAAEAMVPDPVRELDVPTAASSGTVPVDPPAPSTTPPPKLVSPLRRVVSEFEPAASPYGWSQVLLECGHRARSWGGVRARCSAC